MAKSKHHAPKKGLTYAQKQQVRRAQYERLPDDAYVPEQFLTGGEF